MLQTEAPVGGAITLGVGNVTQAARSYARLGLRVTRQGRHQATVDLPCGVRLIVFSPEPSRAVRRRTAAA